MLIHLSKVDTSSRQKPGVNVVVNTDQIIYMHPVEVLLCPDEQTPADRAVLTPATKLYLREQTLPFIVLETAAYIATCGNTGVKPEPVE